MQEAIITRFVPKVKFTIFHFYILRKVPAFLQAMLVNAPENLSSSASLSSSFSCLSILFLSSFYSSRSLRGSN